MTRLEAWLTEGRKLEEGAMRQPGLNYQTESRAAFIKALSWPAEMADNINPNAEPWPNRSVLSHCRIVLRDLLGSIERALYLDPRYQANLLREDARTRVGKQREVIEKMQRVIEAYARESDGKADYIIGVEKETQPDAWVCYGREVDARLEAERALASLLETL